jgi:hypothetical protein
VRQHKISQIILGIFGIFIFFTISVTEASASSLLSLDEQNHLRYLGFAEEVIATMTPEEYKNFSEVEPIEKPVSETILYKLKGNNKGELIDGEKFSLDQGQALMKLDNYSLNAGGAGCTNPVFCNETNSWISVTTSVSRVSDIEYLVNNSFVWKTNPSIVLTDMVGITYSSGFTYKNNSALFSHKYNVGNTQNTRGADKYVPGAQGFAALFDIAGGLAGLASNQHGYLSVRLTKANSNQLSANIYGHYTHTTFAINPYVSIITGDISLGFTTAENKTDPTVLYVVF